MKLPNGFGSVVNLGSRRRRPFAVRVTVGFEKIENNKYRQKYKYIGYYESKEQALIALAKFNENPYNLDNEKITLAEVYQRWSDRHFDRISDATKKNYVSLFKKMKKFHQIPFKDLKNLEMQEIIDLTPKSSAPMMKTLLGMICKFALKNDIVSKDYSKTVEMPKAHQKAKKSLFTSDEVNLIWKHEGNRSADMLLILLYTGMRITELLEMRSENVFLDQRYMIGGKKTENGIDRVIPIHSRISPIIERHMADKYVFQNSRGSHHIYQSIRGLLVEFMRTLGMDHIIHETRHTFISRSDKIGMDKQILKNIVGHSTSDITEHYTHRDPEDLIKAIDTFDY